MKPIRHEYNGIVYFEYEPTITAKSSDLPILMIHGHGGDHRGLELLAGNMKSRVIIPDLPGFGESEELELHSIENYVLKLKKMMKHLKINKYSLVGHSLGSGVALALASADTNVVKLILLNPVPEFTKYIQYILHTINGIGGKIPQKYSDALVSARLYNLATFLMHSRQRRDLTHAKDYLNAQNTTKYSFRTWSESGEAIYTLDQVELAKNIMIPVLIVHGKTDSLTSSATIKEFTSKFKNSELAVVANAGHFLPLEQANDVSIIIQTFLKGLNA